MNPILRYLSENAKKHAPPIIRAESGKAGEPESPEVFHDLEYRGENGTRLFADVYRPAGTSGDCVGETTSGDFSRGCGSGGRHLRKTGKLPVAVFVHGGGLFAGNRKMNRVFCEKLAAAGFLVFSIEYRLISETDAFGELSDVCAGLAFAEREAGGYGGDKNRLFLVGESAGAYLALFAAAMSGSEELRRETGCSAPPVRVKGLIAFSGMFYTEKMDLIGLVYKNDLYGKKIRDRGFIRLMNPENPEVISSLPPVFLTSSKGDFLKSYTLRFAAALKRAGHPCALTYYKDRRDLGHAFPSLAPSTPEGTAVLMKMTRWVNTL